MLMTPLVFSYQWCISKARPSVTHMFQSVSGLGEILTQATWIISCGN